jgi:hypothetical protein
MTRTYTTSIYLAIDGAECERDATITYEYSRAGGDGWHEPRYEAGATVVSVDVEYVGRDMKPHRIDLEPLLTKEMLSELEARCCQHENECDEVACDEAADLMRESARELQ